ncbi:MAG: hypothetical protein ABII22_04300 [Candidatus Micrarchaeota archaeon]
MAELLVKTHPEVLFANMQNSIDIILRMENKGQVCWAEADVNVPEKISLSPTSQLGKGRIRIGIIDSGAFLEKAIKVYASSDTEPGTYDCNIILFTYNKDGVVEERLEKTADIQCEPKRKEVL